MTDQHKDWCREVFKACCLSDRSQKNKRKQELAQEHILLFNQEAEECSWCQRGAYWQLLLIH